MGKVLDKIQETLPHPKIRF